MYSFFRELKQRRVYRIAIAYAVGAWLGIQIASTVFPTFGVPLWILQTLIAALALGFPAALVFAWIFEINASGIEITPEGSGPAALRNKRHLFLLASAGLLIALIAIGGYWLWHPWRNTFAILDKSIAVLPLENLSEEKENSFFSDGIQDDLLSSLAKIKELKVISRSSVMGYRDAAKRNLREIGQQLGVSNILEGSVRRAADRVLVNVALIDTRTGQQLWAERYDRTLADSLTLQGELATEIANALRATLSPEEKERVETKPTENADAYVLYLRAREYQIRPTGLLQDYQMAERLYTQAVELDPKFALAHARLSDTLTYFYLNFQPTPEIQARARAEAEEALRLQPNSGEGYLARALCLYRLDHDYEPALREMEVAARFFPGDPQIDFFSGAIRRRQGRWADALSNMKRAFARDPRNNLIAREILLTESLLRDWSAAARIGERAVALAPDLPMVKVERSYVAFWAGGDLRPLRAVLAAVPADINPDGEVTLAKWDAALLARDFAAAEEAVIKTSPEKAITPFGSILPKTYLLGCIALARGDDARAQTLLESARPEIEEDAGAFPKDAFRQAQLGLLYAFLGRKEEAIRFGRRARELKPEAKDAYFGPCITGMLALIYVRTDEREQALALLDHLLSIPGPLCQVFDGSITLSDLRARWQWDPIRKDPRFQKILTSPEPKTVY